MFSAAGPPAPDHPKPSVPVLGWVIFYSRCTSLFHTAPFSLGTRQENALFPALLLVFPGAQREDQAAAELNPRRARRRLRAAPAPLPCGTGARNAPERCGSPEHGPARSRSPIPPFRPVQARSGPAHPALTAAGGAVALPEGRRRARVTRGAGRAAQGGMCLLLFLPLLFVPLPRTSWVLVGAVPAVVGSRNHRLS